MGIIYRGRIKKRSWETKGVWELLVSYTDIESGYVSECLNEGNSSSPISKRRKKTWNG